MARFPVSRLAAAMSAFLCWSPSAYAQCGYGTSDSNAATRAKRMELSLSTFLHTTLSLDPMHDVPPDPKNARAQNFAAVRGICTTAASVRPVV